MKKTIQSIYNTFIIIHGSDNPYFLSSSSWCNDAGYKKPIPPLCKEFSKNTDYSAGLSPDSLVSAKDIEDFFNANSRKRKIIVFIGSKKDIEELNSIKFKPIRSSFLCYLDYLYFCKKDIKAAFIFINEINVLFPVDKLRMPGCFNNEELIQKYKNSFSENKEAYLNSLPFIFKE